MEGKENFSLCRRQRLKFSFPSPDKILLEIEIDLNSKTGLQIKTRFYLFADIFQHAFPVREQDAVRRTVYLVPGAGDADDFSPGKA